MANYYAKTISEGGIVAKKNIQKVQSIIDCYEFGSDQDLTVKLIPMNDKAGNHEVQIYGDDTCTAYELQENDGTPDYDCDCMDNFLSSIAPYLEDVLVVKEVGSEGYRYVTAWAYIVKHNKVTSVSLQEAIERV